MPPLTCRRTVTQTGSGEAAIARGILRKRDEARPQCTGPGINDLSLNYSNDCAEDWRTAPHHEHGDERLSNTSANPTFCDILDQARASRRAFPAGGVAAAVTAGAVTVGQSPKVALARASSLPGFAPVPLFQDDTVVVPVGYKMQLLAPWGTPITADAPAYAPGAFTGTGQAQQVGSHHDGMHFFPIDGSSTDGLLVMNHEYIEPRLPNAEKRKGQAIDGETLVMLDGDKRDEDEVLADINAHGVTVVRVTKQADGAWAATMDPHNRCIIGLTEMVLSGPVKGSAHVATKFSPDGTKTRGRLNNFANGYTPWNTYMAAEENWAGHIVNATEEQPREHKRYGISDEASRCHWEKATSGGDEYARFNAVASGADAKQDYRNVPNTFGYMVEIDRFDPASVPVRRTVLGRFGHEGVVFAPVTAGRPVVCYSGDDSRFEYIYNFVSSAPYGQGTRGEILDERTLYVAKFNADGSGEFLALAPGQNGLADLAHIIVNTRAAADQAGATKRDRPEWGTVDPAKGEVYFTLTNNNRRTQLQVDAVKPRAGNNFGSVVRWKEPDGDFAATQCTWELFVLAGTKVQSKTIANEALNDDNLFVCPGGIWCDPNSRLWIQTDMGDIGPEQKGPLEPFGTNRMLCADPRSGEIRRFLTGPWGLGNHRRDLDPRRHPAPVGHAGHQPRRWRRDRGLRPPPQDRIGPDGPMPSLRFLWRDVRPPIPRPAAPRARSGGLPSVP